MTARAIALAILWPRNKAGPSTVFTRIGRVTHWAASAVAAAILFSAMSWAVGNLVDEFRSPQLAEVSSAPDGSAGQGHSNPFDQFDAQPKWQSAPPVQQVPAPDWEGSRFLFWVGVFVFLAGRASRYVLANE